MGFPSMHHRHEDRIASALLCHILGGGMSSRLFLELRERRGLCYQIGSFSCHYRDTGALQIAASCAPGKARELVQRTMAECRQLADCGPSQAELDRAKLQLRTSLVFSQESTSSRMFSIAHQTMHMDKILNIDQQLTEIESVGLEKVCSVAKAVLDTKHAGIVALGAKKGSEIRQTDL
jgi:predicted Zn-dependent peptidase